MGVIIIDTILAMVLGYVNYKISWYPGILCMAESFFLAFLCWIYFRIIDRHVKEINPIDHLSIAFIILISDLIWTVAIYYVSKAFGG